MTCRGGGGLVRQLARGEFLRGVKGSEVTHHAPAAGSWALAPTLGGPDRHTLSLLSPETTGTGVDQGHAVGFIETLRVERERARARLP